MSATSTPVNRLVTLTHGVMEAVVLALVCLAPWAFASIHPLFEFVLLAGVALLLALWALAVLLEWRFTWHRCPVAVCLAVLCLFGLVQLLPLPDAALRVLSPTTVEWTQRLLPETPEAVTPDAAGVPSPWAAGRTLSLCPADTRRAVVRLLAVFLLFAAVRNTFASAASLYRLSVAALANAVLLTLFALAQYFTSPPFHIYWVYPTGGTPFGPFICRNHFPFYVNICVGLGVGLLLATRSADHARRGVAPGLLQHAPSMWVVTALALVVAGVAYSQSRGGLLSLAAACLAGALVHGTTTRRLTGLAAWAAVGVAALALLAWLGLPRVEARLAPLLAGELNDGRWTIWAHCLVLARLFPWWGTGYGTFQHAESTQRSFGEPWHLFSEYAHNDYLEALVEGGVVRLAVSVLAVALLLWLGYRAYRRQSDRPAGGLALGALIGLVSVAVHSAVDFGLHMPAIAFFATVLAAQVAALGAPREYHEHTLRLGGVAPPLAAVVAVTAALLLARDGWALAQAERFRLAALHHSYETALESRRRCVAYLEHAVRFAPHDPDLHLALAEAYKAQWEGQPDATEPRTLAIVHYLLARDLKPLLAAPNVRLAELRPYLARGDAAGTYLRRAAFVRPADAQVWFLLGVQELHDGRRDDALASWRNSLACADEYRDAILRRAAEAYSDRDLAEHLLPDHPDELAGAAFLLHPEAPPRRRPFLERALRLLEAEAQTRGLSPAELRLRGRVQADLGQADAAVASYRLALGRAPQEVGWRAELARLLFDQGKREEAERECLQCLRDQPANEAARRLQDELTQRHRVP